MKILFKVFTTISCILLASTSLYAQGKQRYMVSGDMNYPPYEFINEDGQPDGFNIHLLKAVAEEMDLPISIELKPWFQARKDIEEGKVDILPGMYYSRDRDKKVDFSHPHTLVHHVIYIRENNAAILSLEELIGKRVLCEQGDIIHDTLSKHYKQADIIPVQSQTDALLLLSAGRYDCAIVGEQQGLYITRLHDIDNIQITGTALEPEKYCFAVTEGNTTLLNKLNKGLRHIKQSGKYYEIYSHWFGRYEKLTLNDISTYVTIPFTILGIILLVLVAFSIIMRKRVQAKTRELARQLIKTKEAQVEADNSRDFLQKILDSIPTPVYFKDINGTFMGCNTSFLRYAGVERRRVIGNKIENFAPSYAEQINETDSDLLKGGKPLRFEIEITLPDENTVQFLFHKTLYYDRRGTPEGIIGIITDITELKEKEEKISLLSIAIDYASSVIIVTDTKGIIEYVNPTFTAVTGYLPEEAVGREITMIKSGFHTIEFDDELWNQIQSGNVWKGEVLNRKKDGTLYWESVSIAPVFNSAGEITNYISIHDDITRQKMYQESLLQSKNNFLNIITSSHDAIVVLNNNGFVQYINPAAEDLFNESVEHMLQEPLPLNLREEQEEVSLPMPDGSIRYFELTFIPTRWQGEHAKVAVFHDITRDREAVEETRKSLEEKNVLLKEIHHRVKNNMQLISSMLHLQAVHNPESTTDDVFKDIESRIRSMALIHEKLYQSKDYAHIELGQYIRDLAMSLYNTYQADLSRIKLDSSIEVQNFDIDTAIPCGLILNELISNSIKHAFPENRSGYIYVSMKNLDNNTIELAVKDNGIGMHPDKHRKRDESMGMLLIDTLARQLKGTLTIESDHGTTFRIIFPNPGLS